MYNYCPSIVCPTFFFEILNSSPKIQTAPQFCSPLSTHLEHEVFVEVWIKVGEVITARRAPALAPFVGKETYSEKRGERGFVHVVVVVIALPFAIPLARGR